MFSYVIFFTNMIFNGYLFQHHYINLTKSIICLNLPEGTQSCLGQHPGTLLNGPVLPAPPSPHPQLQPPLSPHQGYLQFTLLPMLLLPSHPLPRQRGQPR